METRGDGAVPAGGWADTDRRKHRKLLAPPEEAPESFARDYQLEALEMAKKENTMVFLETGSGKTLIAIMLLRSFAYELRKPSKYVAVFLVPTVVLVTQQEETIRLHTDLKVRKLYGDMGVDFWDAKAWKKELDEYEVFVMTPAILQRNLEHSFFKLDMLKLLVFDECHHARGGHPYASIMREFYHRQLQLNSAELPRILGMTASPLKTKGSNSSDMYAKEICALETLMNSKVYTVASESVLAKYIPFSTPKLKVYEHFDMPQELFLRLAGQLESLKMKHVECLHEDLYDADVIEVSKKRIAKLYATFLFCLTELGIWLLIKAAECLASNNVDIFFWAQTKDIALEKAVRNFSRDVFQEFSRYVRPDWIIGANLSADVGAGLLTAKVNCLIESLVEYRVNKNLRCIVFVERVVTAIVLHSLVSKLPQFSFWTTTYVAGNRPGLQSQTRKEQSRIVDAFREGTVNIIFATQILEEGLDVQSCNLVIRFDISQTVCSFIQSRGRARMKGSEYLLLLRRGDSCTRSKVMHYLSSGDIMREESLRLASCPCPPLETDIHDEDFFRIESTGAVLSLSSSVQLTYFYCSKLPSDGYFKPSPRYVINKDLETCTLYLPRNSPIQQVSVQGPVKRLKKIASLEACKQLHAVGALTDFLVPLFDEDENVDCSEEGDSTYEDEQLNYFPTELVARWPSFRENQLYHGYLIHFDSNVDHGISFRNIILVVKCELDNEVTAGGCQLDAYRGSVRVDIKYIGTIFLDSDMVSIGRLFQLTILRILLDHNLCKLNDTLKGYQEDNVSRVGYLLLPAISDCSNPTIDWKSVRSAMFHSPIYRFTGCINRSHTVPQCSCQKGGARLMQTYNCRICSCLLKNSIVCTPHNGRLYYISDVLDNLNGNSNMQLKNGEVVKYKEYFQSRYECILCYASESLLRGRHLFTIQNCFRRLPLRKLKDAPPTYVELPPELCEIVMSPISIGTLYAYSFVPSIMHHIESMLLVVGLKMEMNPSSQVVNLPAVKVREAITTKHCQLGFSLESLETLGDSFLKYAVCQQLFRENQLYHEGLLSSKKDRLVSNKALFKLGSRRQLPGFIRNECFDPQKWTIPGDPFTCLGEEKETFFRSKKIYHRGTRKLKVKVVADVVEALVGACLSSGGELVALSFMEWLGLKINFIKEVPSRSPFMTRPEMHVNISHIESLLNYSFHDPSLLVEALTHGSYMVPEIPKCYQRLEFLGDSILDYLITIHMYNKYPGMSPGLLTDLRSASVNNDCYAHAAVKAGLHKHILYASSELHRQIASVVSEVDKSVPGYSFGWEFETTMPKALGDIIESIGGAILVDSAFRKEIVWQSIRPLLEPLITPDTIKYHPVRELQEISAQYSYDLEYVKTFENGVASMTAMLKVDGHIYCETCTAPNKKMAKRLAAKAILEKIKQVNMQR